MQLTFGSLFAGIGGLDLGLERAGMRCAWQVEINDYASKVLAKHWPDVARFRDIRDCGAHNLTTVDLIAGGFPCQDISEAGKGAGLAGERSGLWSEFHRLISELRPRYALVENVSALLGRGMGAVLGDLAAIGYDAEWSVVSACAVGAPHTRERVFILAHRPGIYGEPHGPIFRGEIPAGIRAWWTSEPGMVRVAYGVPHRVDRLRGLGNAVVPQVAEFIGRRIVEVLG